MCLASWFPMKKKELNIWRGTLGYTLGRLNTMSITVWTSTAAVEANGVRVLTLLLSTITSEMLFRELDISYTIERFFLRFLWIPLKRRTLLAKPFPLFIASPILDNDGPSTSIGSTSAEGWHWRLTNSLLPVESPDPSVLSFGIWPLGIHAFFPVITVPSNMISMEAIFRKPFLEMVVAWGHACMYTTNSYDTI